MNTTAQDIMATELITLTEEDTLEDALKSLINNRITGLPVLDKELKMIGILSEFDILKQVAKHKVLKPEIFQEKIEFSHAPFGIPPTTPLNDVVKHFINEKYRRIAVLDKDQKLVGIITRRDLMRVFYYRAKLS
jgi:CBS domain-containing protein